MVGLEMIQNAIFYASKSLQASTQFLYATVAIETHYAEGGMGVGTAGGGSRACHRLAELQSRRWPFGGHAPACSLAYCGE
jgi:hypothetical protein